MDRCFLSMAVWIQYYKDKTLMNYKLVTFKVLPKYIRAYWYKKPQNNKTRNMLKYTEHIVWCYDP